MKSIRNLIFGAAALLAVLASAPKVEAAQLMMCAPDAVATATGARRVVNPNTTNAYALNSAGCAVIALADIGYFLTQGYTTGPEQGAIIFQTGVATGVTDFLIGTLPPSTYIQQVVIQNTTGNAVTGGVDIGTTATSSDVVNAVACAATCIVNVANASILKQVFSPSVSQPLHALAATAWNSANVIITVIFGYF